MPGVLHWACRLLGLSFLLIVNLAYAGDDTVSVPELHARVTDLTATLTAVQIQRLENKLAALETKKGAQLAILLLPSTQPEEIETYAIRVFDRWKLGRKNVNDGVLLLIAKDDHRARIEVAYGLEGAIPDIIASRIIREYLTPYFRKGDFFTGIDEATSALTKLIDGESLPEPMDKNLKLNALWPWDPLGLFIGALLGLFPALFVNHMLAWLPTNVRRIFVVVASAGFVLYLAGWSLAVISAIFVGAFWVSVAESPLARVIAGTGSRWIGSSGRGGGSGGGFSGGGGMSGGGGASGSW